MCVIVVRCFVCVGGGVAMRSGDCTQGGSVGPGKQHVPELHLPAVGGGRGWFHGGPSAATGKQWNAQGEVQCRRVSARTCPCGWNRAEWQK